MREAPDALLILREERDGGEFKVPDKLVERVYQIEYQVQFDDARRDVAQKLREAINVVLDEEQLKGETRGNAV